MCLCMCVHIKENRGKEIKWIQDGTGPYTRDSNGYSRTEKKKNLTLNSLQMFKSRLNTAKKQD